jgi:hypothetical protein
MYRVGLLVFLAIMRAVFFERSKRYLPMEKSFLCQRAFVLRQ